MTGPRWSVFDLVDDHLFLPPTPGAVTERPAGRAGAARPRRVRQPGLGHRALACPGSPEDPYERKDEAPDQATDGALVDPRVGSALVYRLASSVPDYWIPFAPVSVDPAAAQTNPVIQLERRAIQRVDPTVSVARCSRRGCCSAPTRPDRPRASRHCGSRRRRCHAKGHWSSAASSMRAGSAGARLLWLGRRKTVGRGEWSSGLRFDILDRP